MAQDSLNRAKNKNDFIVIGLSCPSLSVRIREVDLFAHLASYVAEGAYNFICGGHHESLLVI
jgi:hypothetical protein